MTAPNADYERAEEQALAEVKKHALNGCCADGTWRGRYCQYHLGMADGVEVLLITLRGEFDAAPNDGSVEGGEVQ